MSYFASSASRRAVDHDQTRWLTASELPRRSSSRCFVVPQSMQVLSAKNSARRLAIHSRWYRRLGLSVGDRAHPVPRRMRCSRAVLIWSSAGIRWPSQFSITPA